MTLAFLTVYPDQAPAGATVELVGQGFPAFTTVSALTIGSVSVLPVPSPNTGGSGDFSASILVPDLDVATWSLEAMVGGIRGFTALTITQPTPSPVPTIEVSEAFAEAIATDPGLQVWGFPQGRWRLFQAALPPDPVDGLVHVAPGDGVWIFNSTNTTITTMILGRPHALSPGWNLKGL